MAGLVAILFVLAFTQTAILVLTIKFALDVARGHASLCRNCIEMAERIAALESAQPKDMPVICFDPASGESFTVTAMIRESDACQWVVSGLQCEE